MKENTPPHDDDNPVRIVDVSTWVEFISSSE
jgi:hypothetical protein